MRRFSLQDIAHILDSSINREHSSLMASGVSFDSRNVGVESLFFALPGDKTDGHLYLDEAFASGAVAAVVCKTNKHPLNHTQPLIFVDDVKDALQKLAHYYIKKFTGKIVAVTGSVGKTTTKDFITTLLKEKYTVASSPGNSNSQLGLPYTIINETTGLEDVIVLEMGMTHPGQISKLVAIAPPDIAVITAVELVHAVNFDSLEDIGLAKGEILLHPKTTCGIISQDIKPFSKIFDLGTCSKVTFSVTSNQADYSIQKGSSTEFSIKTPESDSQMLPLPLLPGAHNLHNLLAAIAVAKQLFLSWNEIENGISKLKLAERRLQQVEKNGIIFINDAYNANVISVKAALNSLPVPKHGGRKIAVLGEMKELGKFSESCHREVGVAALNCVDLLYCLGEECLPLQESWTKEKRDATLFMERHQLVTHLRTVLKKGDVVLLKASFSKQMWKVIEEL